MPGKLLLRHLLGLAVVVATTLGFSPHAQAQVYIAYREAGIVNKFDADTGALITERFIHGLTEPRALCLDQGVLYVLQQGGVVGKYDAESGAVINDHFISGFNMPQAMAVSDGAVFVASFAWQFQNVAPGQTNNLIGKYDASTGACINASFLTTDELAAALMVSGQKLFVLGGNFPNKPAVFDTTSGTPVAQHYAPFLTSSAGITPQDNWVWFTAGRGAPFGMVFKYDVNTGQSAVSGGLFHPLIMHIPSPSVIAASGDELFVGCGSSRGTGVAKYNATTGDLIKTDFIPDRGDEFAGIAVAPRAASGQYLLANAEFATRNTFMSGLFWASTNGTALYFASAILVLLVIVGVMLAYRYRSPEPAPELATGVPPQIGGDVTPVEQAALPAETTQEPIVNPVQTLEAPTTDASTPPARVEPSFWGMVLLGLFGFTLLFAGVLAWFASQSVDLSHPRPDHTPDLIGLWGIDPNDAANAGGVPVYRQVYVYPTHLEYSGGHGTTRLDGQWRDDGFWYSKPDGSGDVEVCHLQDPLNLEIHLSAFNSGEQGDNVLYKERGSDEEMKEITNRYPAPITYPPPADVFKFWMSEYELNSLPWRADRIEVWNDDPAYSRAKIYDYHSDNPQIPQLQVTVKNHRVVKVSSGTSDPLSHINP